MCNCYSAQCEKCDKMLPMHLGDFDTGEDEIQVFCDAHIPEEDVRVFVMTEDESDLGDKFPQGYRIGIRALTENARQCADKNHPNLCNFAVEIEYIENIFMLKPTNDDWR